MLCSDGMLTAASAYPQIPGVKAILLSAVALLVSGLLLKLYLTTKLPSISKVCRPCLGRTLPVNYGHRRQLPSTCREASPSFILLPMAVVGGRGSCGESHLPGLAGCPHQTLCMTMLAGPGLLHHAVESTIPPKGRLGMLQVCGGSSAEVFSRDTSESSPWPGRKLITMQSQKPSSVCRLLSTLGMACQWQNCCRMPSQSST